MSSNILHIIRHGKCHHLYVRKVRRSVTSSQAQWRWDTPLSPPPLCLKTRTPKRLALLDGTPSRAQFEPGHVLALHTHHTCIIGRGERNWRHPPSVNYISTKCGISFLDSSLTDENALQYQPWYYRGAERQPSAQAGIHPPQPHVRIVNRAHD